jgi:hypothetical protein
VRAGLRSLLDTLSHRPGAPSMPPSPATRKPRIDRRAASSVDDDYQLEPTSPKTRQPKPAPVKARAIASRGKTARVTSKPVRHAKAKAKTSAKRKRANA